jgi:hypothetical protein
MVLLLIKSSVWCSCGSQEGGGGRPGTCGTGDPSGAVIHFLDAQLDHLAVGVDVDGLHVAHVLADLSQRTSGAGCDATLQRYERGAPRTWLSTHGVPREYPESTSSVPRCVRTSTGPLTEVGR